MSGKRLRRYTADMKNPKRALIYVLIVTTTLALAAPVNGWAMLVPAAPASATDARAADMKTIQKTLESKVVRERLRALGLTDKEIETRLAKLSDAQVHKLAKDVDTLAAGGFIEALLVIVVLVLLIVFLAKRI